MEVKKNPEADLSKKTGLYFNIGLVITMLLVITAFEWRFYDDDSLVNLGEVESTFEDIMDIPPTEQPPPPPPKIQQPEVIEVPDEEEIEEDAIDLKNTLTTRRAPNWRRSSKTS